MAMWLNYLIIALMQPVVYCTTSNVYSVSCKNGLPSVSHYVQTAVTHQLSANLGCISKEVATQSYTGKSVYVILLEDSEEWKRRREVTLHISPIKGSQRQSILVLSAVQPIAWKLSSTGRVKLNIVITNTSRIHKDTNVIDKVTRTTIPTVAEGLLQWTRHHYGAVSAFTTASFETSIISLNLGDNSVKPSKCTPANNFSSPIMSLSSFSVTPSTGCIQFNNANINGRDVYVLELTGEAPGKVLVDLHSPSAIQKNLVLILQSNSDRKTSWFVTTTNVRGEIDIITEGDVDTSDIQMHTVRVVTAEPMKTLTGSSLINWVSYKYDAPFLYASAQKANRMSVLVTKETGATKVEVNDGEKEDVDVSEEKNDNGMTQEMLSILLSTRTVSCYGERVVVAIQKDVLQIVSNAGGRLSLYDSKCRASENATHFILTTNYDQCHTKRIGSNNMENAIVLHVEDQYVEDYKLPSTVWSKFFCNTIANNNSAEVNNDKSVAYVLKTCVSGYSTCGENTDSKLSIGGKLNLQAEVFSDNRLLRVVADNCWLSSSSSGDNPLHWLIAKSCKSDSTVHWHATDSDEQLRFSFTLGISMEVLSPFYVHCQFSVCDSDYSSPAPECLSREQYCIRAASQQTIPLSTSVSLGPISVEKNNSNGQSANEKCKEEHVTRVVGADTTTVIGIAFGAFSIGVIFTGVLWLIHARTGRKKSCSSGNRSYVAASGDSTPSSTAPLAVRQVKIVT